MKPSMSLSARIRAKKKMAGTLHKDLVDEDVFEPKADDEVLESAKNRMAPESEMEPMPAADDMDDAKKKRMERARMMLRKASK